LAEVITVVARGDIAQVRRRQYVGQRAERVPGRQRFAVEHIQPGASEAFLRQCLDQRLLVDQAVTCGVDQVTVCRQAGQGGRINDAPRALTQHQVQRDHITVSKQRLLGGC